MGSRRRSSRHVRIVDYNSAIEFQPATAPVSAAKLIAKHNTIGPAEAEAAINEALEAGRLAEAAGRLRTVE